MEDEARKPMKMYELEAEVEKLIRRKWNEQFPDDFICVNTDDINVLRSVSKFAYRSYVLALNCLDNVILDNPRYRVTDGDGAQFGIEAQIEAQERLLNDIKTTDNIKMWVIDNVGFRS
jgi:hypothetical protein